MKKPLCGPIDHGSQSMEPSKPVPDLQVSCASRSDHCSILETTVLICRQNGLLLTSRLSGADHAMRNHSLSRDQQVLRHSWSCIRHPFFSCLSEQFFRLFDVRGRLHVNRIQISIYEDKHSLRHKRVVLKSGLRVVLSIPRANLSGMSSSEE